jgi:hypothetical protein
MMPLQIGRKARKLEKVEKLCRSATAQSILPNMPGLGRSHLADHACAMALLPAAGSAPPANAGRPCRK